MPEAYPPSPGDSDSLLDELASYGSRTPSPQPGEDDPVALQEYIHKITKGELEAPVHQVMDTKKLYGGLFLSFPLLSHLVVHGFVPKPVT